MKHITRFALPTIMLLWLFSIGMESAVAGNSSLVLPKQRLQPVIKVAPGQTQPYHYRAETRARSKKQGKVQAGGLVWQCQGNACTISGPWPAPAVGACQALARQVGPMQSYGHAGKKLSARQLKQCNAGIASGVSRLHTKQARPTITVPGQPMGLSTHAPRVPVPTPRTVRSKKAVPQSGFALPTSSGLKVPGLRKPVTGPAGKPLLPPQARTGTRHLLRSDMPAVPHGGFAPVSPSGSKRFGLNKPVTGRDGKSLLPPGETTGSVHVLESHTATLHGGVAVQQNGVVEVPRLSLAVEGVFEVGSGGRLRRLDEVAPGEHVYIRVALRNTGLADSEPILVGSDRYGDRGPYTLHPGDVMHLQYTDTVGTDHMDSENKMWFRGSFVLRSPSGAPVRYQNENAADDHLRLMSSSLAITGISAVRLNYDIVPLHSHNHLPGHISNGFDVKITAKVSVKNTGRFASLPTTMNVSLIAEQPANYHAHLHEGGDSGMKLVRSVSGDVNPKLSLSIPAIQAGESFTKLVVFTRLPHQLWDMDSYYRIFGVRRHSHDPLLAGTYACSHTAINPDGHRITPAWAGTQVRVRAEIAHDGGGVAQFSKDGVIYSSAKSIDGTLGNANGYGCSLK